MFLRLPTFLGRGHDTGKTPVEQTVFLFVYPYFRFCCPSIPSWPSLRPSQPCLTHSQPGPRSCQPGLRPSHPSLRPNRPGLRPNHPSKAALPVQHEFVPIRAASLLGAYPQEIKERTYLSTKVQQSRSQGPLSKCFLGFAHNMMYVCTTVQSQDTQFF